jgi:hypothetical protein
MTNTLLNYLAALALVLLLLLTISHGYKRLLGGVTKVTVSQMRQGQG